jgi:hypothetical protein
MRDIDDEIAQASTGLPQRGRCGLHPFDVPAPSLALSPKARLAEDYCRANSALGGIVRRLDALPLDEGPHRRFRSQDPSTHTGRLVPDAPRAFPQEPDHSDPEMARPPFQGRTVNLLGEVQMPEAKHRVHQTKHPFSNPAQVLLALRHTAEVADQVSEANLALIQVDICVARVAVADHDTAGLIADQVLPGGLASDARSICVPVPR